MQTVSFTIISNWDALDCEVLTTDSHNSLKWSKGRFSPANPHLLGPSLITHRKKVGKKSCFSPLTQYGSV